MEQLLQNVKLLLLLSVKLCKARGMKLFSLVGKFILLFLQTFSPFLQIRIYNGWKFHLSFEGVMNIWMSFLNMAYRVRPFCFLNYKTIESLGHITFCDITTVEVTEYVICKFTV